MTGVKTGLIVATFVVAGWLIEKEIRDLFSLKRKKGDALMTGDFVLISDCAFTQPIDAGQLEHGEGNIYFSLCVLVKSFHRS